MPFTIKTLRRVIYIPLEGFRCPSQGFIISLEGFRYPSQGFIIPLEGFRYPSWGFIIPLEGFSYPSKGFIIPLDSQILQKFPISKFWEIPQISSHLRNYQNLKNIPPSNSYWNLMVVYFKYFINFLNAWVSGKFSKFLFSSKV